VKNKESIHSFYESIAKEYDGQLTSNDTKARKEIAQLFDDQLTGGTVLDFGGGTGLDLPWLLASQKKIFFLEPSSSMRAVAKEKFRNTPGVEFLENRLDFNAWSAEKLPFNEKVKGVVANFAVINCIKNIDLFFEKISLVAEKDSSMMITIIDPRFHAVMKNYSILTALRLFVSGTVTILNRNKDMYHETYLHSLDTFRRAAQKYFQINSIITVSFSDFIVIALKKKL
jgi:ubiquinone/menaquinone biosynthesis C-methylase UbiE